MPYDPSDSLRVTRLSSADVPGALTNSLIALLRDTPRKLHTTLGYDPEGSKIFAELCSQPEYYLTRTEERLIRAESHEIVKTAKPKEIIDLGCGNFEKTQNLIHAAVQQEGNVRFIPCDVDETIIIDSIPHLRHFYSDRLDIEALVGTYEDALAYLNKREQARLFAFIGSTFGNLSDTERRYLLHSLVSNMGTSDTFLLGVDLVKSPRLLEAAYNDAAGCLKASVMQIIVNLNRDYGADFDIDNMDHIARFEPDSRRVVSYVVSKVSQSVFVERLGLRLDLAEGEMLEAEFYEKFVLHELLDYLAANGLRTVRVATDPQMPYALILARKACPTIDWVPDDND